MRMLRTSLFLLFGTLSIVTLPGTAAAEKQVLTRPATVHHATYHHYPRYGYHYYRPYYYRPYFYPYYYPGFYPYGFGFGYGFGYGGGYGHPYGYYYEPYGEVRTEVKPNDAKVFVDGDYVGEADNFDGWWQRLNLEPGRHRIVFRSPGFVPYAVTLRVLPGQDYHIKQDMHPGDDVIPESEMRLPESEYRRDYGYRDRRNQPNDKYDDRRPEYDQDREYPDDRNYENEPNYGNEPDYRNQPDPGNQPDYGDQPDPGDQPEYGNPPQDQRYPEDRPQSDNKRPIVLQVEPADATVYIDGDYYGTANINASGEVQVLLPEGVHRIEVVRPGYESYSKEIHVNGQYSERIMISLKKK